MVIVIYAPLTGVALVKVPGVEDPPCYAVGPRWGCRDEHAPQMFNTHVDPTVHTETVEDSHPFPKVLEALKGKMKEIREVS